MKTKKAKTRVIATAQVKYKNKYLILHRSKDNRFDPGMWEPVSVRVTGKKPLEALLVEAVREKTGIEATIEKVGSAFEFNDIEGRWIVVPYLLTTDQNIVNLLENMIDFFGLNFWKLPILITTGLF